MSLKSIENLIKQNKNVYYQNSDINSKNFPIPKKIQTKNWKLIKMDKSFSSQEALNKIKSEGCRPANIYELITWSKNNQKKGTLVLAFGSILEDADGDHRVPIVIADSDGDFRFDLGNFERDWRGDICLLCFCDKSLDTKTLDSSDSLKLKNLISEIKEVLKKYES